MELIAGIVIGSYLVFVIFLSFAWSKKNSGPDSSETSEDFLSVAIPVRNEAENIIELLSDLSSQQLEKKYEIVVVDDESEDETSEKVEDFITKNGSHIELIRQHSNGNAPITPKKRAWNAGMEASDGNIIVTTTAIAGNISNVNDPSEAVIGFFGAHSVTKTDKFIKRSILENIQRWLFACGDCRVRPGSSLETPVPYR